jgi:hypothetical protein
MAVALALAFATAPLVLDECAASCELSRITTDAAAAATCHHTGSGAPHMAEQSSTCGHDHATVSAVTNAPPIASWTLRSALFVALTPSVVAIQGAVSLERPFASPPSSPPSPRRSLSLRI